MATNSTVASIPMQQTCYGPASPLAQASSLEIYDTTLRDGAQAEDVSFSAEDKVVSPNSSTSLGVQFIEGGWPGANPKDIEFFRIIKTIPLKHATVVAFGSTQKSQQRRPERS